jgi:hypothetical protein
LEKLNKLVEALPAESEVDSDGTQLAQPLFGVFKNKNSKCC